MVSIEKDELNDFLRKEAVMTLLKSTAPQQKASEEEYNLYDSWVAEAEVAGINPVHYIIRKTKSISTPLVNLFMTNLIYNLPEVQDQKNWTVHYHDLIFILEEYWSEHSDRNGMLLWEITQCFKSLVDFFDSAQPTPAQFEDIGQGMAKIAEMIHENFHNEQTLGTALTAIAFLKDTNKHDTVRLCQQLLDRSYDYLNTDVSAILLQSANILIQYGEDNASDRLKAFDAMESLLRYLLRKYHQDTNYQAEESVLHTIFEQLSYHKYMDALAFLYYSIPGIDKPGEMPDLTALAHPVWTGDMATWEHNFRTTSLAYMQELANTRYALLPQKKELMVNFSNWTIQYPKMLNSVPMGLSILKEDALDEMLMDLKHELIHVYSLFGMVGLVLDLMRWALVDLELYLHLFSSSHKIEQEELELFLKGKKPVGLIKPDLTLLSLAERSAAVENKIKIYEQVWTPWFEGLALYGEFADDPTTDPDIESPVTSIFSNLIDFNPLHGDIKNLDDFKKVASEHKNLMEKHYHQAIENQGSNLLWPYLKSNHKQYLPGYLAVRATVKKWRVALGDTKLSSAQAFRILLHLTRFSGAEVVPNLSLAPKEFQVACIDQQIKWFEFIGSVHLEDLKVFLESADIFSTRTLAWLNGRLVYEPEKLAQFEQLQRAFMVKKTKEILDYGVGHFSLQQSFPDDQLDLVRKKISIFTQSTANSWVNEKGEIGFVGRYTIMPLGSVECPFWLQTQNKYLSCLVRTREKNIETGKPSYHRITFQLAEKDYKYLEEYVSKHGSAYIKLTRAVVLGGVDSVANSHHYCIYQLGEWMRVTSAGLIFNRPVENEIVEMLSERFSPDLGVDFKEIINHVDKPCSQRSLEWLCSNQWGNISFREQQINAEPWAERVKKLCEENLQADTDTIEKVSLAILKAIYPDGMLAQEVHENGLAAAKSFGNSIANIIDYLLVSGKSPGIKSGYPNAEEEFFKPI